MSELHKSKNFIDDWKTLNPLIPRKILRKKLTSTIHFRYSQQGIPRRLNGGKLGLRKREILATAKED